jgi:hypothetical protein
MLTHGFFSVVLVSMGALRQVQRASAHLHTRKHIRRLNLALSLHVLVAVAHRFFPRGCTTHPFSIHQIRAPCFGSFHSLVIPIMASFFKHHLLLSILFVPNVFAQSNPDTITDPTKRAEYVLAGLGQWYNTSTGIWETAGWWNRYVPCTRCELLCICSIEQAD